MKKKLITDYDWDFEKLAKQFINKNIVIKSNDDINKYLKSIAQFNKIVKNYIKMKNIK